MDGWRDGLLVSCCCPEGTVLLFSVASCSGKPGLGCDVWLLEGVITQWDLAPFLLSTSSCSAVSCAGHSALSGCVPAGSHALGSQRSASASSLAAPIQAPAAILEDQTMQPGDNMGSNPTHTYPCRRVGQRLRARVEEKLKFHGVQHFSQIRLVCL